MRIIRILLFALFVIAGIFSYLAYNSIFGPNTSLTEKKLFIPSGSDYNDLIGILESQDAIYNVRSFRLVSQLMKYGERIRPGHFIIPPEISNRKLIQLLRSGEQTPVNVTISTARKLENIAGVVNNSIEADSISIYNSLVNSQFLEELALDKETAISLIIPNTYELFWNTNGPQFAERMKSEYKRFWNQEREAKLLDLGLSKSEVSTLASIIEKESNLKSERPTIAGVYINRLAKDIPLQADPTVVFGIGDFTIRRVLNKHLETDTPYNTYMHTGLPPGPICMPSISSIDAVLNYVPHDYLFFCAKPGYNNGHAFAKTNAEHARNARRYHRWLNQEGIRG